MADDSRSPRRLALLALACGLAATALIAIGAILVGSFNGTDARFIATSLGFSVFSALGAAGINASRRPGALRGLGSVALGAASLSFVLLLIVLWGRPAGALRAFGVVTLLALATSHACLVLSARRETDTPLIAGLAAVSIGSGSFDAFVGIIAIAGIVQRVHAGVIRLLAVLVIVFVATSVLPPILRRAAGISSVSRY